MPLDFNRIRSLRAERALSQSEAATAAGFNSLQAWSNIELGSKPDPRLSTVERVAKALGVTVNDLLTPDGPADPPPSRKHPTKPRTRKG